MAASESPLNGICQAALELQSFCEARNWRFCFIGGLALQAWAAARTTLDADLTLLTGWTGEEIYVDSILESFRARHPDARAFALQHRVLLVASHAGVNLDICLGAMPFEENAVARSSLREIAPGVLLRVCSADLACVVGWVYLGAAMSLTSRAKCGRNWSCSGCRSEVPIEFELCWECGQSRARGRA